MASAYLFAMLAVTPSKSREVALIEPRVEAGPVCFDFRAAPATRELELTRGRKSVVVRITPVFIVDDPEPLRRIAEAGGGIAVLPRSFVEDALTSGVLVEVLPGWSLRTATINAVYRVELGLLAQRACLRRPHDRIPIGTRSQEVRWTSARPARSAADRRRGGLMRRRRARQHSCLRVTTPVAGTPARLATAWPQPKISPTHSTTSGTSWSSRRGSL